MKRIAVLAAGIWLLCGLCDVFAQGVQTGTIRGVVKDAQELPVPGVTVTATSPALQGARVATTDAQGLYALTLLPAGTYSLKFDIQGFQTVARSVALPLGLTTEQNVTIQPSGVTEAVTVTSAVPAPIASAVVGQNFLHDEVEQLASLRTLQGIAQLAPAVTDNTPNAGQIVINGAFAFDNIFMINGVDVNDNLFAQSRTLFVEDAIQETQVLTSGISAEYGRFSGGVVNAITKSGGNTFSGSGRVNFLNPSWTTQTPFEVSRNTAHVDALSKIYEGTLGGPILRDKLWFFSAGRYASVDNQRTLPQTGVGLISNSLDKRGEVKLTGSVNAGHTIQGGFLNDPSTTTNDSGLQTFVIDPHSETTRSNPNWYYYANYRGVLRNNLLVEAQYSQRKFEFDQEGPSGSNFVTDTPIISATQCLCLYNAPYFANQFDPEQRNNRQLTGNVTSDWSLRGHHQTKAGYEWFRSQRIGGNSQSPTQYSINADFATNGADAPILDSTGRPIPVFESGVTSISYYPAVVGATLNVDNHSLFVQDHWAINSHWSADLGARYEHAKVASTGDVVSIDNNRIVPRLAVGYDVNGDGDHIIHATYAQYSGRYNEAQVGKNSPVGNPPEIDANYTGPDGQGYAFAPGFSLANYPINAANASVSDPTKNVFMAPGTKSPLTHEFTLSYGTNLSNGRGYAELSYIARTTHDLIEDFQTLAGGTTNVVVNGISAGMFTNIVYQNTDLAHRDYQGLVFQSRYRMTPRWSVNGNWTVQLKNDGNYEGEGTSLPGNTSFIGNYPEAFNAVRNFPDGHLQDFQRHRLKLWSIYDLDMRRYGDVSISGLWRVYSGLAYSLASRNQGLTAVQQSLIRAAGYPDLPSNTQNGGNMVFFGDRGSQTFPGYAVVDMSINYNVPVFRSLRPWVKFDVYNLFDNLKVIAYNTTVSQNPASAKDNLGLATGYTPSATFGTATGNTVTNLYNTGIQAYPLAFTGATPGGRTFRVALGFRF
jgi:outer membrane receptor protein involved in Fe transport